MAAPDDADTPRGADPLPDPDRPAAGDTLICSAKGCRHPAEFTLAWNNPKLHAPDRRKTWLACAEHRESLSAFLDARGFLRDVTPIPHEHS